MSKAKSWVDDARELATLRAANVSVYARDKELRTRLIKAAADKGENFKEVIAGVGVVKVSAPKDKHCKGTAPEVVVEVFLGLSERERERLTEKGIVKVAEQWSSAYYGSVTVELF